MIDRIIEYPVGDDPPSARLIYGVDVLDGLRMLDAESIQVVCTSPPYWGLRDYGTGDAQFGLEESPQEYVGRMVEIFREIRRVLRPDGVVWLNLGDSYVGSGVNNGTVNAGISKAAERGDVKEKYRPGHSVTGLKPKDLVGIPWRVALALQDDGWWLRQEIIWAKANCMPEPVKDRCTRNHETVFMLTKSPRYFYDHIAIKEPCGPISAGNTSRKSPGDVDRPSGTLGVSPPWDASAASGRNKRTVWNVNPRPYPGAHFAVWPPELVDPMIKAGSSEKGCCAFCGKPLKRLIEKGEILSTGGSSTGARASNMDHVSPLGQDPETSAYNTGDMVQRADVTVGWEPCSCTTPAQTRRCVVLDPFCGSATTGMVALGLGRDFVGIDLNEEYIGLAESRLLGRKIKKVELEDGGLLEMFGEGGP